MSFKSELHAALSWQCWCAQDDFISHCHQLAQLHSFAESLFPYCSDLKPLQICFVQPSDCGSGSTFSVLLYVYLLKLILVLVHYETSEVNPCKEMRAERLSVKAWSFQCYVCDYWLLLKVTYLGCVCRDHDLNCWSVRWEGELLLSNSTMSWLATTEPGMGRSQRVIAEGVGLCYRILCPLLGGLLASFLPLAFYRKGCLFKRLC